MRRLIDDLLDHAKIESGSLALQLKTQLAEPLLREVATRFEPLAANKKIRLTYAPARDLPSLTIDRDRLDQVLSNFLGNAIKFTPEGGEIRLRAEKRAGDLLLSVSDNGPGMPPEQTDHVFDRYWQARGTAHQGAGLGLAIAKSIVQAHGGQVGVDSVPGHGTTFYAKLPCATEDRRPDNFRRV